MTTRELMHKCVDGVCDFFEEISARVLDLFTPKYGEEYQGDYVMVPQGFQQMNEAPAHNDTLSQEAEAQARKIP